ncbi:hypothetical protein HER39_12625, partial [Arthrobacter deserti]|nr:hypothetical protein [Arthrobacter deserti]
RAAAANADILMIGILPTLKRQLVEDMSWLSSGKRYAALNTSVLQARG